MATKSTVIGILGTQQQVDKTIIELREQGFATSDISVLFSDRHGTRDFALEENSKAPEGAIAGAGVGGLAGGALGLLMGIGALAVPGLGLFIAAGPIMAALSGAAAGALVGGVAGTLVGFGIPELEAKQYEGKVRSGGILLSVHVDSDGERARSKRVLAENGATQIVATREAHVPRAQAVAQ